MPNSKVLTDEEYLNRIKSRNREIATFNRHKLTDWVYEPLYNWFIATCELCNGYVAIRNSKPDVSCKYTILSNWNYAIWDLKKAGEGGKICWGAILEDERRKKESIVRESLVPLAKALVFADEDEILEALMSSWNHHIDYRNNPLTYE